MKKIKDMRGLFAVTGLSYVCKACCGLVLPKVDSKSNSNNICNYNKMLLAAVQGQHCWGTKKALLMRSYLQNRHRELFIKQLSTWQPPTRGGGAEGQRGKPLKLLLSSFVNRQMNCMQLSGNSSSSSRGNSNSSKVAQT